MGANHDEVFGDEASRASNPGQVLDQARADRWIGLAIGGKCSDETLGLLQSHLGLFTNSFWVNGTGAGEHPCADGSEHAALINDEQGQPTPWQRGGFYPPGAVCGEPDESGNFAYSDEGYFEDGNPVNGGGPGEGVA